MHFGLWNLWNIFMKNLFFITMRWLPSKPEIVWYWYCHKSFSRNIVEKSRWPWCPAGDASRLLPYYISLLSGLENIDDQNRTPNSNKGLFTYYHFIIGCLKIGRVSYNPLQYCWEILWDFRDTTIFSGYFLLLLMSLSCHYWLIWVEILYSLI